MSSGSESVSRASVGRTLLKLSPLLVPFVCLFLCGLVMAVGQSFGFWLPISTAEPAGSAYLKLLEPHLLHSFLHSLRVALISAFLSVALGGVVAYLVWRLPKGLERLAKTYKTPLVLPHIAVAFIVLVFWGQSGVFASIGHHLGLVDTVNDFPNVLYGGGGAGMIMAYVFKGTPFAIILGYAVLKRLDPRLVDTARMLGAGPTTCFFRVVLPHMRPALNTAFIILFLYAFGAFDIPFLLGESSPGMISIEAFNLYFRRDLINRPTAMAILVCMFVFSVGFIALYTRVASKLRERERKL